MIEEPEAEIPVACELARICSEPEYLKGWTPLKGECSKPCIVAGLTGVTVLDEQVMNRIGFTVGEVNDPVKSASSSSDRQICTNLYLLSIVSSPFLYAPTLHNGEAFRL